MRKLLVVTVALALGLVVAVALSAAEWLLLDRLHLWLPVAGTLLGAGAVFALSDRLGLIPDPPKPLSLFDESSELKSREGYTGGDSVRPR